MMIRPYGKRIIISKSKNFEMVVYHEKRGGKIISKTRHELIDHKKQ